MPKKILLTSACFAVMLPTSALAENLFLLQMGVFSSQERANQQFSEIEADHGKLLEGKRYILRQSRPLSGGSTSWRVLVGPYNDRRSASRNCAELKGKGADCFVVETARVNVDEFKDATQLASQSQPAEVQTANQTPAPKEALSPRAQSTSSSGISSVMPWNWFDSEGGSSTRSAAPTRQAEAKPEETELADAAPSSSGSNININTHSVYEKKKPMVKTGPNLASLFGFGEDDEREDAAPEVRIAEKAEPVPAPKPEAIAAPVEDVVVQKPSVELPHTPEQALQTPMPEHTEIPQKRKGEVNVAEAIPVPLMEPKDVPVTVSKPAPKAPSNLLNVQLPNTKPALAPAPISKPVAPQTPRVAQPVVLEPKPRVATTTEIPASTTPTTPAVKPTPRPVVEQPRYTQAPTRMPLREYQQRFQNSRSLQVSVFENDRDAFSCLSQVQSTVPASGMLRTRIIKSTIGKAVLRFGPIRDPNLETEICSAVSRCSPNLRCRILTEQGTGRKPLRTVDPDVRRPNKTYRKPIDISPRHNSRSRQVSAPPTRRVGGPVWIQLGTSSSKSDAQSRFSGLKKQHSDLLSSHSPTISKPEGQSLAGNVYRLRIGPFNSRSDAQGLCAKLSSRGVGCLILNK